MAVNPCMDCDALDQVCVSMTRRISLVATEFSDKKDFDITKRYACKERSVTSHFVFSFAI